MELYIVTTYWDYDGAAAQWIFTDLPSARAKYDSLVAGGSDALYVDGGDVITLRGPFASGDNIYKGNNKLIANCRP